MLTLISSLALAAPTVELTGTCPGQINVTITGATPYGPIAAATSPNPGGFVLPFGPCMGTATGLSGAGVVPAAPAVADGAGNAYLTPTVPAAACGRLGQVMDIATCAPSNVFEIPPDCTFVPDPALAVGETGQLVGTTAAHNDWRTRVGSPRVFWDSALAATAQTWADTCPQGHDPNTTNIAGYAYIGENIYYSTQSQDGAAATASWVSERADYDFGTEVSLANYTIFGHYTQVVWDSTVAIGCGVADCGQWRTTLVCRYGESGNWLGETPYDYSAGACYDLDNDDVLQASDADDTDRNAM